MDLIMCPFFQGVPDSIIGVLCQGQPCIDLLYAEKSTCTDISVNCEKKIYFFVFNNYNSKKYFSENFA